MTPGLRKLLWWMFVLAAIGAMVVWAFDPAS